MAVNGTGHFQLGLCMWLEGREGGGGKGTFLLSKEEDFSDSQKLRVKKI